MAQLSNLQQQRIMVEQLRREASLKRMPVSEGATIMWNAVVPTLTSAISVSYSSDGGVLGPRALSRLGGIAVLPKFTYLVVVVRQAPEHDTFTELFSFSTSLSCHIHHSIFISVEMN
ncbi:hypothetical protein Pcinc_021021 [Petrolisthes cinctipes]|uniref:G protein gamma domain-containing protein n=1 Tax=Petrolisthes cinctipes TaxID=88211 RepID=A0AAE1FGZ1_PETCI|nr:hypothetical protein Pcinc_021021 [Petrolisthes cinctipes]